MNRRQIGHVENEAQWLQERRVEVALLRFKSERQLHHIQTLPAPNYQALGLGSRDECEGRN